ncbi:ATP-dependent helicase [Vibrio mediterranei]|uniref:ATP-dependent helicase n=1 Tax=Vibrio mediterranei TaxID=689 RepID=UPI0038CDEF69
MNQSQLSERLPAEPIKNVLVALNDKQRTAATTLHNNVRVVAGPGTGKTKTMEAKVAVELHRGVDPTSILALSFTNESSNEFQSRIQQTCGYKGHLVQTGTFHAVCNKILRKYSNHDFFKSKLGYKEGFFIIDDDDSKKVMSEAIKTLAPGLKELIQALEIKDKDFLSRMSLLRAKCMNAGMFARTVVKHDETINTWTELTNNFKNSVDASSINHAVSAFVSDPQLHDCLLSHVWSAYTKRCRVFHGIDFDDVLINTYLLLKHNLDVAAKVASNINHLLIDEYQDTNPIQAHFVRLLRNANPDMKLFIVGDGRQSIYDFRGSDVSLMTNADQFFGEFEDHELNINYRSDSKLIEMSNIFALGMPNQLTHGQLISMADDSQPISEAHYFSSDIDEAKWVVNHIRGLLNAGVPSNEIYIMYRNRTASRLVEEQLQQNHMQYDLLGEKNFYERMEVRDAVAMLRSVVRPKDVLAWSRQCACMPVPIRGLWLREKQMEQQHIHPIEILKSRAKGKNAHAVNEWLSFYDSVSQVILADKRQLIEEFIIEDGAQMSVDDATHYIETNNEAASAFKQWSGEFWDDVFDDLIDNYCERVKAQYEKDDKGKVTQDGRDVSTGRLERVALFFTEVRNRLKDGEVIHDIMDDVMTRDNKQSQEMRNIIVSTGHKAKGLEAKHCIVVGCDTAIWQKGKEISEQELEEAGRLFYVMLTRAKDTNYFTMSASRRQYDKIVRSVPFQPIKESFDQCHAGLLTRVDHGFNKAAGDTSSNQAKTHENNGKATSNNKFLGRLKERFSNTDTSNMSP